MNLRRVHGRLLAWAACAFAAVVATGAWAETPPIADRTALDPGAVVFAYSRFGEDRYPNQSVRIEQFEAHLEELKNGDYTVWPLPRIVEALRKGEPLPDRTVAITIDDAWTSAYEEAFPRLRDAGFPFTIFLSPRPIDAGWPGHVGWGEIREMMRGGATIAAMTQSNLPMPERRLNDIRGDLGDVRERLRAELGGEPTLFAYPFGEYSLPVRGLIEKAGFQAAFGQQSGVAHGSADFFALPRFVMNEPFGSLDRFRLAANALPLPVEDLTPDEPVLTDGNPPNLGFTVARAVGSLESLACFASGQGRTRLERLDDNRVEVRISDPFPPGRGRINCTLPATEGRWRWFGAQFFIPAR